MSSIEKRLKALADQIQNLRPACPVCHNQLVTIVIEEDPDGGGERVSGERCQTCGSPDAVVVRIVYEDEIPVNPADGLRDYPYEQ